MKGDLVTIVRDGKLINVDGGSLCKGDVVVLQAGEIVPADLKLIDARALEIDEFDLTGEIMPVSKNLDNDFNVYKGSRILKGSCRGIVVAIGEQTEYGKVLKSSWEQNEPYEIHLFEKENLGPILLLLPAFAVLLIQSKNHFGVIAFFLFLAIILLFLQNYKLHNYWIISNELKNLDRFKIQIRDPRALERMNEIDTICFDKTGVLTTRDMDVKRIYYVSTSDKFIDHGTRARITKLACALCNDVIFYEKFDYADPVDIALISFAQKNGIDVNEALMQYKRIYDKPFDSENRYMACGFERDDEEYYFAKGDPSVILKLCRYFLTESGEKKIADFNYWSINSSHIDTITQKGGSVIALAYTSEIKKEIPIEYTFLCLVHLDNPLQPGVRDVIRYISSEGIRSMLLTGDRSETAVRIGLESGIARNSKVFLTGQTIERMAQSEVAKQSSYCSVFTRLMPSQKGLIIMLLKQKNHYVAMVGDGYNDGIALRVSDIGISFVRNSSDIARRLSKILINDLNDLKRLFEGSNRIKNRIEELQTFRALFLVILLLGLYAWVFFLIF